MGDRSGHAPDAACRTRGTGIAAGSADAAVDRISRAGGAYTTCSARTGGPTIARMAARTGHAGHRTLPGGPACATGAARAAIAAVAAVPSSAVAFTGEPRRPGRTIATVAAGSTHTAVAAAATRAGQQAASASSTTGATDTAVAAERSAAAGQDSVDSAGPGEPGTAVAAVTTGSPQPVACSANAASPTQAAGAAVAAIAEHPAAGTTGPAVAAVVTLAAGTAVAPHAGHAADIAIQVVDRPGGTGTAVTGQESAIAQVADARQPAEERVVGAGEEVHPVADHDAAEQTHRSVVEPVQQRIIRRVQRR